MESQEILLNSLANSGVSIPPGVSSVRDLSPDTLFSICSQSLHLIDQTLSSPASLPEDPISDRFGACRGLSSAFKSLGFIGHISFHKFLYPSQEDLHKLLRFLVERLSESSEAYMVTEEQDNANVTTEGLKSIQSQKTDNKGVVSLVEDAAARLRDLNQKILAPESTKMQSQDGSTEEIETVQHRLQAVENVAGVSQTGNQCSTKEGFSIVENDRRSKQDVDNPKNALEGEETIDLGNKECLAKNEDRRTLHHECSSKSKYKDPKLPNQDKLLMKELAAGSEDLHYRQEDQEVSRASSEMESDDQHPSDLNIKQLSDQVEDKSKKLVELKSQWSLLEEKQRGVADALCGSRPDVYGKLRKLKELDQKIESLQAESDRREEELRKLAADAERQPKAASRRSHIGKIVEITKNSRKLDTDIERVLKDTRELQMESNSIQERLHRTYAIVDETILREAKKDPVGREAYRLLTSIHDSFEQVAGKILATDRTRREVADYESKLATMNYRSINIDILKADLEAIRKENDLLAKGMQNQGRN